MTLLEKVQRHGYRNARLFSNGNAAATHDLLYTCAILLFTEGGIDCGYEDRWCYHIPMEAQQALANWDGNGDPEGWHRHPSSGRRRDEHGVEYISR